MLTCGGTYLRKTCEYFKAETGTWEPSDLGKSLQILEAYNVESYQTFDRRETLTLREAASEMHPECLFQANHKKVQKRNFSFKAPLPLVGLKNGLFYDNGSKKGGIEGEIWPNKILMKKI